MVRVLFICLGNICRSPMGEYVLKDMVKKRGLEDQFEIASAATSREEIGNDVHYGTKSKLCSVGIPCPRRQAVQVTKWDYAHYDHLIAMDSWNVRTLNRMFRNDPDHKVSMMLDYTSRPGDVADPWYTGNFEETYMDITDGCNGFLKYLEREGKI